MKLYFNGVLVGSDPYTGSFSGLKSGARFYLGESVTPTDPPSKFKGAIGEFRVWKRARSEAEIKADMFKALTGNEAGLVGALEFRPRDQRRRQGPFSRRARRKADRHRARRRGAAARRRSSRPRQTGPRLGRHQ